MSGENSGFDVDWVVE